MGVAAAQQGTGSASVVVWRLVILTAATVLIGCRGQNETANSAGLARKMSTSATYYNFRCLDSSNNYNSNVVETDPLPELVIRASSSVLPQLVARIYAIALQNILNSRDRIEIKSQDAEIKANDIDLTIWMMPDFLVRFKYSNLGAIFTDVGTIGWYIPTGLIRKGDFPKELAYTLFQGPIDEDILSQFGEVAEVTHKKIIELAEKNSNSNDINGFYSYAPPWCKQRECVKLLAGYHADTKFVVSHIRNFNLSVQVIWFGENLEKMVDWLMAENALNSSYNGTVNKKFLVLEHSPSVLLNGDVDFTAVRMPTCSELKAKATPYCAYSDLPILKTFPDDKVLEPAEVEFTKRMIFDHKSILAEYTKSLGNASRSDAILDKVACDYVLKNQKNISNWQLPQTENVLSTYILGVMNKPVDSIYGNIIDVVDLAVASVNRNLFLKYNAQLRPIFLNVTCTPWSIMNSYLAFHQNSQNMVGILGPPCTSSLEPISTLSHAMGVPSVTVSATVSALDEASYPYFFRMVAESRFYEPALVDTMKEFNWQRMAIVTEDGMKKSSYLADYFDAEYPIEVLVHQKMPQLAMTDNRANNSKVIQDHLKELHARSAKVILLEMYGESALQVMCEARALNMTARNGFVWFLPAWIGDYAAFNVTKYSTPCTKVEIEEALDYQFSFHYPAFGDDQDYLEHLNITTGEWVAKYKERMNMSWNETIPDKYLAYKFDAVWVYAFALKKVLQKFPHEANLRTWKVSDYLLDTIRETNFVGLSGPIDFRHDHSRRSRIILSQWDKLELREVGGEASLKSTDMQFYSHRIRWWGEGTEPPSDGRMICSVGFLARLLSIECDTAIITVTILMSFVGAILASAAFYMYWRRFYNEKMKVSAQVMRNLGIDLLNTSRAPENLLQEWEIPKEQILLNRKLGEGAFGTVYGGQACVNGSQDLQAVAVKTLKMGSTDEDRYDFLSEAEAMKRFQHPNILGLLGVCLQSEPIFTVIEFMLYGDLKTYLLARRHLVKEKIPDDSDVSAKRLTAMTQDIVRGLVYLAEQKYVHRDIACRNCLVNADRKVKIGDFGMARPTGSNDYYRFNRKGLLPVRWLSPESLGSGFFTPASDIWSFGVLIFEVISFGAFPYQGLSNNEVLEFVKNGNSMDIPQGVNPKLERLLKTCWEADYKKRPKAVQILEFIGNNPRIIAPCVDVPQFSIQFSDSESDQLEFMPSLNQSPDSGIGIGGMGRPITRETLQELAAMPTSQAAADAFQLRMNAAVDRASGKAGQGGFLMGNGGGVPNGNLSLTYNPVEPLLLRQNSNDMSSSSSSLLRYVPMCGFGSKRTATPNYTNHNPNDGSADDSEYTRMSVTEF